MASVSVIGAGPAGLIAAEKLLTAGVSVDIHERKSTPARKFLLAGRGGLNITHSEDLDAFLSRYGAAKDFLAPHIRKFTPQDLRDWCAALGEETFVGSSGRVFPKSFKATALLRAWQARLTSQGARFHFARNWRGWDDAGNLVFNDDIKTKPDATILALGGASWPRLGADGGFAPLLRARDVTVRGFTPSNCGFFTAWSAHFAQKHAGSPLKNIALSCSGHDVRGEAMISATGIEGGAVYALSPVIRNDIERNGAAVLSIDMKPDVSEEKLSVLLSQPRGGMSLSNHLQKRAGLCAAATALAQERRDARDMPPKELARLIKSFPLQLTAPFPIDRAISSAGGIMLDEIDSAMMLKKMPGVFVAGEMTDWEAPTGGYLLQACFSTGVAAAAGILAYLQDR